MGEKSEVIEQLGNIGAAATFGSGISAIITQNATMINVAIAFTGCVVLAISRYSTYILDKSSKDKAHELAKADRNRAHELELQKFEFTKAMAKRESE